MNFLESKEINKAVEAIDGDVSEVADITVDYYGDLWDKAFGIEHAIALGKRIGKKKIYRCASEKHESIYYFVGTIASIVKNIESLKEENEGDED